MAVGAFTINSNPFWLGCCGQGCNMHRWRRLAWERRMRSSSLQKVQHLVHSRLAVKLVFALNFRN
jgi:hypothetical protein